MIILTIVQTDEVIEVMGRRRAHSHVVLLRHRVFFREHALARHGVMLDRTAEIPGFFRQFNGRSFIGIRGGSIMAKVQLGLVTDKSRLRILTIAILANTSVLV